MCKIVKQMRIVKGNFQKLSRNPPRLICLVVILLLVTYYFWRKPVEAPVWLPDTLPEIFGHETTGNIKACMSRRINLVNDQKYLHQMYASLFGSKYANCSSNIQVIDVIDGKFKYLKPGIRCSGTLIDFAAPESVSETDIGAIKNGDLMPGIFVKAACDGFPPTGLVNLSRNQTLVKKKKTRLKPKNLNLDIIMMTFDSISRPAADYMIPKTMKFLRKQMKATVLDDYNIVGDGTTAALLGMFAGGAERDYPTTLKDAPGAIFVDEAYPLLFQEFQQNGYLTGFFERMTKYAAFSYRLKGFKQKPTDYYSIPLYSRTEEYFQRHCYRNYTEAGFNLFVVKTLQENYPDIPKFLFFQNAITHDHLDSLKSMEDDLLNFLHDLHRDKKRLSRAVFMLLSDHGPRFSNFRNTYNGRLEERSPLFAISLPPWFRQKFRTSVSNLKSNSAQLATPYDIHATLKQLLYGLTYEDQGTPTRKRKGISLFHKIPESRTCEDAAIEPHWCTCLSEKRMDTASEEAKAVADAVVKTINQLLQPASQLCAPLRLVSISRVTLMEPHKALLKFAGAVDKIGYKIGFDSDVIAAVQVQILLSTSPGNATYEATLTTESTFKRFVIDPKAVSIVNRYGSNPHCVIDRYHELRKFCVCKDKLSALKVV